MQAKAAILYKINEPLQIKYLEIPSLMPGQVLVEVAYSGICRSQLMEQQGKRGVDSWLPHLLGHEGVGTVVDVGPGVTKVKAGDEVILGWIKSSGLDVSGAVYECEGRTINSGPVTTFSTHTIVSESRVYIKPKALPLKQAVLLGCAIPTGAGMVFNEIKPEMSDSVLVLGLGGIGSSAMLALKALGIANIIVADVNSSKLNFAKKIPGVQAYNASDGSLENFLSEHFPEGVDYCVEAGGSVESIELGFRLIKKNGGKIVFSSHPPTGEKIALDPHELIAGKTIIGSWGGGFSPDRDIKKISNVLKKYGNYYQDILSKEYVLDEINEALTDIMLGNTIRPLVRMK